MSPRKKEILYKNSAFRLGARSLKQDGLTAQLVSQDCLQITENGVTRSVSIPTAVPRGAVGYRGSMPLLSAMYNMAMHELYRGISPEGLLTAGAAWSTVWTRDIAYAAALGADIAAPAATRRSLESRVRDGVILQDTGTGGGWPISTDRVVWVLGAWAYYQSSGDREWLEFAIDTIRRTLEQDAPVLRATPLIPGETSFIDWRDQSYPDWMTPADIGASYSFGTNVLHYMARRIMARMLCEAGRKDEAAPYAQAAAELAAAIDKAFHSSSVQSYDMLRTADGCTEQRSDALATALAVLAGLAGNRAEQIMRALPRTPYGTPVFAPFKSTTPESYHNRAVWPFVEAYVLLAHADLQDLRGVEFSMAALLRAAMAFGTNKENLHATTGAAEHTIQSSDSQLWSVAGMLGLFYHGLLGIQYEQGNLVFSPCIPESFAGSHWFTGIRIRNMVLDVHLNGYGSQIFSALINGKPGAPLISLDTVGHVQIELELMPPDDAAAAIEWTQACDDLPTPQWNECSRKHLSWHKVPGATHYRVYMNGTPLPFTTRLSYAIPPAPRKPLRVFHVRAFNRRTGSSVSAPYEHIAPDAVTLLQPKAIGEHAEYSVEHSQAWLDTRPCTSLLVYETATLAKGTYRVRVLYCNATASLRDGDTCALRELCVDGESLAVVPLPHNTEQEHWDDYTYSAPVICKLGEGEHTFSLLFTPRCTNANGHLNQCMVRHIELARIG